MNTRTHAANERCQMLAARAHVFARELIKPRAPSVWRAIFDAERRNAIVFCADSIINERTHEQQTQQVQP